MIVFIPRTWPQSNCGSAAAHDEQEWLPRICPGCGQPGMIGHGRRWKSAHDQNHTRIRVRRGRCRCCRLTITVLPRWSMPYSIYSLHARVEALHRYVEQGKPLEQAAPPTLDPDRVADPATLRRWGQRRPKGRTALCVQLRAALSAAASQAGISAHVVPPSSASSLKPRLTTSLSGFCCAAWFVSAPGLKNSLPVTNQKNRLRLAGYVNRRYYLWLTRVRVCAASIIQSVVKMRMSSCP